jgi:hypothetical protein
MKQGIRIRTVALLWILLSAVSSIQAQSAGDIDTLSEWRVDFEWYDAYYTTYKFYRLYISGDTVINSQYYYKVYLSGYWYDDYGSPPYVFHYYNHELSNMIREEDDKWHVWSGVDKLLYDYRMEVGDTVNSSANGMGTIITVDSIDEILIDGEWKKRFHLQLHCSFCGGAEYIIEDIGATTGLFNHLTYYTTYSELICFAKDGVSLWGASTEDCDLAVSIEEIENAIRISAYPNPFTTSTTLEYELYTICNIQYTVYNMMGEMVFYSQENMLPPGRHTITWSPGHLPAGLYYGVLRSEEGVSVVKMVKE